MFKIINNEITLTRGDSASMSFKCINESTGEEYDYSADNVVFSLKKCPAEPKPLIQKTITDGKLVLEPEDTADLPFGQYYYDVVINKADGSVDTVIPTTVFTVAYEVH